MQDNFGRCFDGCVTWPLTVKKEHKLQASVNQILKKMSPCNKIG